MSTSTRTAGFLAAADCRLDDFRRIVELPTEPADYPFAAAVELGAVVYDAADLRSRLAAGAGRREVMGEIALALLDGPGVVAFRGAFEGAVVDRASEAFFAMIADQQANGRANGDHYAKPGANDRVWNTIEKQAVADPESFVEYYANDIVALASTAWLGPRYQISAQVNVVNPGGEAQRPHRDYHLGFMTEAEAERYPAHVHRLSPVLTLQGAVAHCDMPVETGPTLYLPHSQKYEAGYFAWRRPEFIDYFAEHHVQLALAKGDAVFFNPALFHAAGSNRTADVRRIANLMQISSSMGRTLEVIDTARMTRAVYPALRAARAAGLAPDLVANVIAACAEGYAFPTNLDRDPPLGGLTPPSQTDLLAQAVAEDWSLERFDEALTEHQTRRSSLNPW